MNSSFAPIDTFERRLKRLIPTFVLRCQRVLLGYLSQNAQKHHESQLKICSLEEHLVASAVRSAAGLLGAFTRPIYRTIW